jgi:type II secretory pathway pseudopilin PulG
MTRWQLSRFLLSGLTGISIGLLGSLSMAIAPSSMQSQAQAQASQTSFSEADIAHYAKAALAIETKRQQVYSSAKKLPEWSAIANRAESQGVKVCDLREELPGSIQSVCNELINFSQQVIRDNAFRGNADFNRITRAQQQDDQLQRRIQGKIMELNRR